MECFQIPFVLFKDTQNGRPSSCTVYATLRRWDKLLAHSCDIVIKILRVFVVLTWAPEVLTLLLHKPSVIPCVPPKDDPRDLVRGPRGQSSSFVLRVMLCCPLA